MHAFILRLTALGGAILLAACGPSEPQDKTDRDESVFDPMTDTLERAEAVDDINRDRLRQLNEQLEESER